MKPSRKRIELTKSQHRLDTELELCIAKEIGISDLFEGHTDKATRAARLKVVLIERKLTGNSEWRRKFEQLYGEAL